MLSRVQHSTSAPSKPKNATSVEVRDPGISREAWTIVVCLLTWTRAHLPRGISRRCSPFSLPQRGVRLSLVTRVGVSDQYGSIQCDASSRSLSHAIHTCFVTPSRSWTKYNIALRIASATALYWMMDIPVLWSHENFPAQSWHTLHVCLLTRVAPSPGMSHLDACPHATVVVIVVRSI